MQDIVTSGRTAGRTVDLDLVEAWLREAGELALSHRSGARAFYKEDQTPVTQVDLGIEALLRHRIGAAYPDDSIVMEENGAYPGATEQVWVVDALDGTRAFVSGLPIWGTSIGVFRGQVPIGGAFLMPALDELYRADDRGSFLNGEPLPTSAARGGEDPNAFLAVPSNFHRCYEIEFPRVRSFGSTAAHLVYVARGSAVGALMRPVAIWDVAGVWLMLRHEGIVVEYLVSGEPFQLVALLNGVASKEPLLAAHPDIIDRLRTMIRLRPDERGSRTAAM